MCSGQVKVCLTDFAEMYWLIPRPLPGHVPRFGATLAAPRRATGRSSPTLMDACRAYYDRKVDREYVSDSDSRVRARGIQHQGEPPAPRGVSA
jgi:hypothetical protein